MRDVLLEVLIPANPKMLQSRDRLGVDATCGM